MVGADLFYWPRHWLTYIVFVYLFVGIANFELLFIRFVWSKVSESIQSREEPERKKRKHNLYVMGRLTIPGGVQERCRCSLRDMVSGHGGDELTIELNDPRSLSSLYDSIILWYEEGAGSQAVVWSWCGR